ncbi:uncharacterized protein LOC122665541 [Telopea speciosissima]|uniref:uncharacterized protein LOC122665541 n=1 Tax=Telopea speciosissima TaxID=54955 RepID=UPI001CC63F29|nr:uncharacterized protein LOC122665541 [Telopea speciosissima]
MAETETPLKRLREETEEEEEIEETKRHRPYHDLLSILEDEEEEPHQDDLSSLMTTLQQKLSPSEPHSLSSLPETTATPSETVSIDPPTTSIANIDTRSFKEEGEQKGSTIIRHLLEASNDELGIPKTQIRLQTKYEDEDISGGVYSGGSNNGEDGTTISLFDFPDGLWDFEDFDHETA